jgi:DNA polymerase II small subunit/DNA polymerase delta subunit B
MKMYNDMPEDTTTYRVEIETDEDNPNQLTVCLKSYTNADVWGYNSDTCDYGEMFDFFKDEPSALAYARKLSKESNNCEISLFGDEVSKEEIRTTLYVDDKGLTSDGFIELTEGLEELVEKFIAEEVTASEHDDLDDIRIGLMEFIKDQVGKQS